MQPFGTIRRFEVAGVDGVIAYFAGSDIFQANKRVGECVQACLRDKPTWLKEVVPSYDSILFIYDIFAADSHQLYQFLHSLYEPVSAINSRSNEYQSGQIQPQATVHNLPVWYGAPNANDLDIIAVQRGLTSQQVIELHSQATYQVFAVGFAPGFAYLGEVDERIACPRLTTPRAKVPAGAVAIADTQTAVYPSESPGGWNLLGLCPSPLFSVNPQPHNRLQVGDKVSFYAIDESQYHSLVSENSHAS